MRIDIWKENKMIRWEGSKVCRQDKKVKKVELKSQRLKEKQKANCKNAKSRKGWKNLYGR